MRKQRAFKRYSSLFIIGMILCLGIYTSAAINYPRQTAYKYLNDYAGVVDTNSASQIISLGRELEQKTGAQMTVVTISSLEGIPIEEYANGLFRNWGIGQANQDNGLLILLAVQDKQWRVEVGRGLEGAIPDVLSHQVMEELTQEAFSKGAYGQGLAQAYSQFGDLVAKEYNVTLTHSLRTSLINGTNTNRRTRPSYVYWIILAVLFIDILFNRGRLLRVLFWSSFFGGGGNRRGGGGGYGGFGGGSSNGGGSSGSW
ncbi:MAG: TPM domain-containing protein [Cellulosilyticum sp.]|nr:TPM domain-containing protein [Cellulosilyticum sp.]